ncbi:TetR/AcrR family transcriptional regulator [Labedella endophytica]|uniref:TetR/AcrR family transcriptional regulator n=1 Tax=Labedella endophytica TaxID=1523160 RepID=A0A433JW24_9MICO|nr:TetR/AcrR family transcriptional regulator [Labedella endophytica]RUR03402.1 TetR/AcrR family transcriptional regulator [Labedella endophytica]
MADSAMGVRERRKSKTTRALVAEARRLFTERGLSGFTVEELCDAVGISRRTFFNYFASKDDAVVGVASREPDDELDDAFLAGGDPSSDSLSPTLFEDFLRLMEDRWIRSDVDTTGLRGVATALKAEPRLLARMMELAMRDEAMDIALVEKREGLPAGDLRAAAVVHLAGAFARPSAMEFLGPDNTDPIGEIIARRIAAARAILT